MRDDPMVMAAALALAGAWGGVLAHYGRAALQRWRERSSRGPGGGGSARRDAAPARVAVPVESSRRKRRR